ncbi:hypothetical protein EZV62_008541 [Acer yangbiense]|uniref:F-box domain-containing protein n=1 Tax=Acer yangbiense TaxID=1000413 RepID=A0A5C7IFP1_9ROSI|nr:hypothetical protein EZV62_008541 [Acer yangbiense]
MDKLSELPPFIIHHIMSHLSAKEAAQTSILSKRWKAQYTSFPVLDFHESYTYIMGGDEFSRNPANFNPNRSTKRFCKNLRKFIKFVDASLVRFCELGFSMQKFRLIIGLLDVKQSSTVLDRWLGLVLENRVKELDFKVQTTSRQTMYTLSQTIYFAKSIISLKLSGCKLEPPCGDIRESSPSFPREIGNLYVTIYEDHFAKLLDGLLEVCYPRTLSVSLHRGTYGPFFVEMQAVVIRMISSVGGFLMSHLEDQNPLFLDNFSVDNLKDAPRQYRNGIVRIPLNWRFPEFCAAAAHVASHMGPPVGHMQESRLSSTIAGYCRCVVEVIAPEEDNLIKVEVIAPVEDKLMEGSVSYLLSSFKEMSIKAMYDPRAPPPDWDDSILFVYGEKISKRMVYYSFTNILRPVGRSSSLIHKNIKSSNILLDLELNPHLSDYGLANFHQVFWGSTAASQVHYLGR